jgi:tellurite resistance protein
MLPKLFCKGVPFGTGWWAISFPIAARTSASLKYATYTEAWPVTAIAIILLSTLSMPILVFLIKTLPVLLNGNLFIA